MSDDEELSMEELRAQTEQGDRIDADAETAGQTFVDEIADAMTDVEAGDRPKTIAVRDESLAALLAALDENDDEIEAVGNALCEALDRDPSEEYDRSEILRLAVRVGLYAATPEQMDQLGDAAAERARENI